jgi:hypothetical protein
VQLIEGNNVNDDNWGHLVITDTTTSNGNGGSIRFATGASSSLNPFAGVSGVSEGGSYGGLAFYTRPQSGTATERMKIDSGGHTSFTLGTNAVGSFQDNIGEVSDGTFCLQVSNSAQNALKPLGFRAEDIRFATGSAERMRLSATGDWMVSNTVANVASNYSTQGGCGWVESDNHFEIATTSNRAALEIGKNQANDGDLLVFRKQSTPVGAISVLGGNNLTISGTQTNHCGLSFATNAILPATESATNTGVVDLGATSEKFKNLYLSGTISSGAITASGDITAASGTLSVKPTSGGGGQIGLGDWSNTNPIGISEGLWNTVASDNDYITVYARNSFQIRGYAGGTTHWLAMTGSNFNLVASQNFQIGGTTVIDTGRNITMGASLTVAGDGGSNYTANHIRFMSLNTARGAGHFMMDDVGANTYYTGTAYSDAFNNWGVHYKAANEDEGASTTTHRVLTVSKTGDLTAKGYLNTLTSGFRINGTTVISSGRAITNCTGITLTGGSISSYGSVTAGLGSFLVGTRGKMGQVSNDLFVCSTTSDHSGLKFANGAIHPTDNTGTASDSAQIDLGSGSYRFSDIYARNSTILTSDRNEKQDIEELSDSEQRVAVRAKGLLRKFKWKDAVAEKGDDARIHFGIIAQDLQAAFEAEGLDAGRYAMFTSNTWTEDGVEKTRMGVRYSELLAFIISAI